MADSTKGPQNSSANDDDLNGSDDEMRLNKKAKNGDDNDVLLYPNPDCSLENSVLAIDHILEAIVAELDQETLFDCRLVSRRWMRFCSIALQKMINLEFVYTFKDYKSGSKQQVLLCNGEKDRSIKDLVALMNHSTDFPCRSFWFANYCHDKSDSLAQRFFNAHGAVVKKLGLAGFVLLSDLRRLLVSHVPNLEQLVLDGVEFTWTESDYRLRKSETPQEGRWRREALFQEATTTDPGLSSGFNKPVIKNLRVFACDTRIPNVFIQQLLACSPNLVEVYLQFELLHYLVQPVNRLHLIKKLDISVQKQTIEFLKALADNNNIKALAIRVINLFAYSIPEDPVSYLQAAEALTKILTACSQTCHTLWWNDHIENFVIPTMPRVTHFSFEYYDETETGLPANLFSQGIRLEDTFPNLTWLEISSDFEMENLPIEKIFGNDDPLPFPGVKKVFLQFHAGPDLRQSFQAMFPNAEITEGGGTTNESDDDDSFFSVM